MSIASPETQPTQAAPAESFPYGWRRMSAGGWEGGRTED